MGNGLVNFRRFVFVFDEKVCVLCKKNGEIREFYIIYVLKDNRGKIICSIFRKYVCLICGVIGDNVYTFRYCFVNKVSEIVKYSY